MVEAKAGARASRMRELGAWCFGSEYRACGFICAGILIGEIGTCSPDSGVLRWRNRLGATDGSVSCMTNIAAS